MADTDGPKAAGANGRWIRLALFFSLGLNLLIGGIFVGSAMDRRWHGVRESTRDVGFGPFTAALAQEDRAALRRAFQAAAPGFDDMRQQQRADLAALIATLRAKPWDAVKAQSLIGAQGQRMSEGFHLGGRLLIERLSGMTPEARAAFADRLEQELKRSGRRRH